LPRATLFGGAGAKAWTSTIVPRYQRRMPELNEAVVATYLAGGNTRRIRGALQPLLKAAPLSKSARCRAWWGVVGVLSDGGKHLLALELCGGELFAAWKGCLDDLVARGLRAPVLCIIDGNAGLRRAVGLVWPRAGDTNS